MWDRAATVHDSALRPLTWETAAGRPRPESPRPALADHAEAAGPTVASQAGHDEKAVRVPSYEPLLKPSSCSKVWLAEPAPCPSLPGHSRPSALLLRASARSVPGSSCLWGPGRTLPRGTEAIGHFPLLPAQHPEDLYQLLNRPRDSGQGWAEWPVTRRRGLEHVAGSSARPSPGLGAHGSWQGGCPGRAHGAGRGEPPRGGGGCSLGS